MVVYNLDGRSVDMEGIPPAPITWFTGVLDTVCYPICENWREWCGVEDGSWLSYRVPPLGLELPTLMSYDTFVSQSKLPAFSTESMLQYFRTSSTALGKLTSPEACAVLLVLVLIVRNIKRLIMPVFRTIGRETGRMTHGEEWLKLNEERITKFGEYVYRLVFHTSISVFGLSYFLRQAWWAREGLSFVGTRALFTGFPNQPIEPGMIWYYLIQAAYNMDAMISLLEISFDVKLQNPVSQGKIRFPVFVRWSKTVRGDFGEMFVHHIATNLLIFGSSHCRLNRTGSMVFLIHDVSDVPVDMSKLANFLKWKTSTVVCFFTMTLTWMFTRLYILPFVIYYAVITEGHYTMADGLPPILWVAYKHFFYVLLGLLIFLHLTWFGMFIRMFITLVTKNEAHDYSEHKSGEKQVKKD